MNLVEYQIEAARTCPDLGSDNLNLLHMNMGVNTEIAEALDAIKKHIAYGKELDVINIQEEIADAAWYLVNKAQIRGVVLVDLQKDYSKNYKFSLEDLANSLMSFLWQFNSAYYDEQEFLERLYYFSVCFNLNFYKALENNINKLRIRFPEKFTQEKALNRNLEQERIELEK